MRLLSPAEKRAKAQDLIARAHNAQRILEDPMFKEAVEEYRKRLMDEWETTKPKETAERERLWDQLAALRAVVGRLRQVLETGKLAERKLSDIKKAS